MCSTISLIYKRNRRGPRIEYCETPALTEVQEELAPGKTTLCLLSFRYSEKQVNNNPDTPADLSLKSRHFFPNSIIGYTYITEYDTNYLNCIKTFVKCILNIF